MASFEENDVKIIVGAFGDLEGRELRKREEQGRRSYLKDDSKRKSKWGIGCLKEIGLGLIGFGVIFTLVGLFLFYDRSFVAIGNILFLSGVTLTTGVMSTLQFFFFMKRQNFKGSASFAVGFFLIMIGWPVLGMIGEIYGLFVLFSGFWPAFAVFLRKLPIIGGLFRQSSVSSLFQRNYRVNMGKRIPV
ncbi:vesicle transport protein GOT1-like [Lycium ferocissimum]|uniref:vesicle transport protein GOT1-like n=1 Tax=Lycium ferocissimum TaxID=112874 RepID=UPI00281550C1|nr:vesicle transport protein GOT1-like [Lycium ferocissimum]